MDDRDVVKEDIEKWLEKIPKSERNIPYFTLHRRKGPVSITPQEAIDKLSDKRPVMNYTAASLVRSRGKPAKGGGAVLKADQAIKIGHDVILGQLKTRAKIAPCHFGTVSGLSFSMDDIIAEIKKNTERGKKFRQGFVDLYERFMEKL